MIPSRYIAGDLGAESGRVMLGTLENGRLSLEEIHRFPNGPVGASGSMHWDVVRIFDEMKAGIRKVAGRGKPVASISCDSWGVDYVLLQGAGPFLTPPFHYRDPRTDGGLEGAFSVVPAEEIFAETGIQFMSINTLYQLLADLRDRPDVLGAAERFLAIGDYFNFLLSGVAKAEESLASTTQLYNPVRKAWSTTLIQKFGLPARIFPEVVPSGTVLGSLLPDLIAQTGLPEAPIVAGCSHDTGAAVAAVPGEGKGWAYLSSGTWSLLGVERPAPIINEASRAYNFTNELGFGGSVRFLKNIAGLWIIQECRRSWMKDGKEYSYDDLMGMAGEAAPLKAFIDPMDPGFTRPDDMPHSIVDFCRSTNQPVPGTPGGIVRCVLESLALTYRRTIDQLEEVTGEKLDTIHIVGGGSKNRLLNRLTANATGRTVQAGPVECTAIGNILIQAIALGHVSSLEAARGIVRRSFPMERYEPAGKMLWEDAWNRFQQFTQPSPTRTNS